MICASNLHVLTDPEKAAGDPIPVRNWKKHSTATGTEPAPDSKPKVKRKQGPVCCVF